MILIPANFIEKQILVSKGLKYLVFPILTLMERYKSLERVI